MKAKLDGFLNPQVAIVKYAADPMRELPDIVYWTMGSLSGLDWSRLGFAALPAAVALVFLHRYRWRITVLSADEAVARSLEIPLNTCYSRLRLARLDFAREVARLRGRSEVNP